MENTLQNKACFFAQYWGQDVLMVVLNNGTHVRAKVGASLDLCNEGDYLELMPIEKISRDDCRDIAAMVFTEPNKDEENMVSARNFVMHHFNNKNLSRYYLWKIKPFEDTNLIHVLVTDYLRSRGYAMPYMGIRVETLVEWGWVKLKTA